MVDLLAGQVSIYFNAILQALPYVKAGRLRSLAVTSGRRFPSVPEIPTIAESGVPGYDMTNWYGLLVTGGTPKEHVAKLNAEVVRIISQPDVKERLADEGAMVIGSTPEEFAAFIKRDIATNAQIVKSSGMSVGN